MPYVNLPPGCSHLKFADGEKPLPVVRPGGRVEVSDARARAIDAMSGNGTAGLITAGFREFGGGGRKAGRVCTRCGFRAYAWSATCPRSQCGAPTEQEQP